MEVLIALGGGIFIIALFVMVQFNGLVGLRNQIRDAWANIDTELKRRYDLIPNLVSTVKGYAAHEREVLERVVELRNRCATQITAGTANQADEQQLVASLQRLFAVVENYPQLKADQHFLRLQEELVNTEDRIQAARRFYNGNVRDYRNKCEQFPSSVVAGMFNFKPADYFDVEPAVRHAVPEARF
ncbi:MAG TPA: LemA family protein [Verrucomicrobiae bacterium]|nr:LemA family protein [Verrucomicrobiae bacterium]